MWQTANPRVWVTPGIFQEGSWTIRAGSNVNAATALTPFWQNRQNSFSSSAIQDWRVLGYDYPNFIRRFVDRDNTEEIRKEIVKQIKDLYEDPDPTFLSSTPSEAPEQSTEPGVALRNTEYFDWEVGVKVKQYALGESFNVLIFLDYVEEDSPDGDLGPSYVGSISAFVNSMAEECENCRTQEDAEAEIEGLVYLNRNIVMHPNIGSLDPDVVWPWMSTKVAWRVEKADGTRVPLEEVPSLKVKVYCDRLTLRTGADFPEIVEKTPFDVVNAGA